MFTTAPVPEQSRAQHSVPRTINRCQFLRPSQLKDPAGQTDPALSWVRAQMVLPARNLYLWYRIVTVERSGSNV